MFTAETQGKEHLEGWCWKMTIVHEDMLHLSICRKAEVAKIFSDLATQIGYLDER